MENYDLSTWHPGLNDFRPDVRLQNVVNFTLASLFQFFTKPRHFEPLLLPTSVLPQQRSNAKWTSMSHNIRRGDLLQALAEELQPEIQPSVNRANTVELHGPPGSGKTQLALDFISTYHENYNAILWIDATNENTLIRSYERCAATLELPAPSRHARHYHFQRPSCYSRRISLVTSISGTSSQMDSSF